MWAGESGGRQGLGKTPRGVAGDAALPRAGTAHCGKELCSQQPGVSPQERSV